MTRIVQKYGGTSVNSPERIRNVAARIKRAHDAGANVAVVVSAQGGETKRFLALAHEITHITPGRQVDVLL